MWCKHTNYEQAARIPLMISAPGATGPNTTAAALVESVDLYPTLCALADLPTPSGLDGRDFSAVLRDPTARTKDAIFHVYPRGKRLGRAVRTDRYRLVEWKRFGADDASTIYELYDYESDPHETKNLAQDQPGVVAELKPLLAAQPPAIRPVAAQP
jgi:iduronate 2-sulfatase